MNPKTRKLRKRVVSDVSVALRAYSERTDKPPRSGSPRTAGGWPEDVLIFDTETTTDAVQRLLFGCYRHYRWTAARKLELVQEGLFYADDLPESDPAAYRTLREYAKAASLPLLSRNSFCWHVFHKIAYKAQGLVAGFNLPLTSLV